jgi:hypothetical protein
MGISVKENDLHDVCSTESDKTPQLTYSPDPNWANFFYSVKQGHPTRSPQSCIMQPAATFLKYIYTYCKKLHGNLSKEITLKENKTNFSYFIQSQTFTI